MLNQPLMLRQYGKVICTERHERFVCAHREEHDRRVAQQMHEEASREEQRQREIEVCIINFY